MFKSNGEAGFSVTFANGWTVSVQWSDRHYCSNRFVEGSTDSENAEVWRWDKNGDSHGEDVRGYMSPDEVLKYMAETAAKQQKN